MRAQSIIIAAYLAVVLAVLLVFIEFTFILPKTIIRSEPGVAGISVYEIIESRGNWTARELVEALISKYNPEYVNVSIRVYNILDDNKLIWRDQASYRELNVTIDDLIIYYYVFTKLYRNGHYVEYIVEVGFK